MEMVQTGAFSLKKRRIQKGYKTASQFAREIGMLPRTWWMCEKNNHLPMNYEQEKMARQLLDIPNDIKSIASQKTSFRKYRRLEYPEAEKTEYAGPRDTDPLPQKTAVSTIQLMAKLNKAIKDVLCEGSEGQREQLITWMRTYLLGLEV